MGGHGNERCRKKCGPEGIFTFKNSFDLLHKVALVRRPKAPKGEITGLVKFGLKSIPALWNGVGEVPKNKSQSSEHDKGLNEVGPDDCLNSPKGCVDGGEGNENQEGAESNEQLLGLSGA